MNDEARMTKRCLPDTGEEAPSVDVCSARVRISCFELPSWLPLRFASLPPGGGPSPFGRLGISSFVIPRSSRSGLTLIEVMLATVILAVGLTALVTATSRCLAVAGKAKEYETARRLVGQVDLEIPIEFEELEEGAESGRFSGEFRDYTWRREIIELLRQRSRPYLFSNSVAPPIVAASIRALRATRSITSSPGSKSVPGEDAIERLGFWSW